MTSAFYYLLVDTPSPTFGFTADQIIKEGRVKQEDIDLLKDWLSTQDLPKLSDEQLVLFLLSCYNEQEATRATIKAYNSTRNSAPMVFTNRTVSREDVQKQMRTTETCVLPERTDDGCAIVFHRLHDTNYSNYEMEPAMKVLFMTLDLAIKDHPPNGLVILFDMKGVGLMHLTRVKLGAVKVFFRYLQEGLPVRLKNIHVLNSVYFIDKVMAIIKPFIKKEVLELIHFHPSSMDMDAFYKSFLPKRCLPMEFGGDLPSTRTLNDENIEQLAEMQQHFKLEELQRSST